MNLNLEKNLKKINIGYIISMGLLFLFLGLIISVQTKAQAEKDVLKRAPSRQLEELVALLKESEEKKVELEKQVSELRDQIEKLRFSKSPKLTKDQLDQIYKMAGLTEISGAGVKVLLDDRKSSKTPTADNDGLVHADDILKLVNELKSAGASAIAVNNQRLVTTSEIIEAGNSVMINQTRLVAPYEIQAVGDPEALKVALSFRGSIIEYLQFYGIDVKIKPEKKTISLPAYTGKIEE